MRKKRWLEEQFIGGEEREDNTKSKWEGWAVRCGKKGSSHGDETKHSPVLFSGS